MKSVLARTAGVLVAVTSTIAVAAPNGPLRDVLSNLRANSTPDQYEMFQSAIETSPQLEKQLGELAASGLLTKFEVGELAALPPRRGPFSAWVSGSVWAFTPDFVRQQAKTRYYDVVMPGDVLGNNMVFALGDLAYRTKDASDLAGAEQALKAHFAHDAAVARTNSVLINGGGPLEQYAQLESRHTASAFIQGWNDTVDAAVQENGARPLTVRQVVSLSLNLRYRAVFIRAVQSKDHQLQYANDGHIEPNDANRDAIANALLTMPMYDLQ
jgi:hypothetical protein